MKLEGKSFSMKNMKVALSATCFRGPLLMAIVFPENKSSLTAKVFHLFSIPTVIGIVFSGIKHTYKLLSSKIFPKDYFRCSLLYRCQFASSNSNGQILPFCFSFSLFLWQTYVIVAISWKVLFQVAIDLLMFANTRLNTSQIITLISIMTTYIKATNQAS